MFFEKITVIAVLSILIAEFILLFLVVRPYWLSYVFGDLKWNPKKDRLRSFTHISMLFSILVALIVITRIGVPYDIVSKYLIVTLLILATSLVVFGLYFFINEQKFLYTPGAQEFKQLFQTQNFKNIHIKLYELGVLDKSGRWVGGPLKNKRDISILMSVLIVNGILPTDNYKEVHRLACEYFQVNFNYEEMTKLIKNYKADDPEPKDLKSYKVLNFLDDIRC